MFLSQPRLLFRQTTYQVIPGLAPGRILLLPIGYCGMLE